MLELTFPPNYSPTIQPYARDTAAPVGPSIVGEVSNTRPTLYEFDVSGLANGDYVVDIDSPRGRFLFRKFNSIYLMADEWWQLDYLTNPADDVSKILVDQNYGGLGALTYSLAGIPVADAIIELFLFSDYVAGNRNGNYRLNNSRQKLDGNWAVPFYIDPQIYVLRYYRNGVAGPDYWKVVVSFDPADIVITPLQAAGSSLAILGVALKPVSLTPVPPPVKIPAIPLQLVDGIKIDQNYGGPKALTYLLNNKPVAGATIQFFNADDYNSDHRFSASVVAQTEQKANGSWVSSVSLPPGNYVINCFKKNVAGPNAFSLVVSSSLNPPTHPPVTLPVVENKPLGEVHLDQDYGGSSALVYRLNGKPVAGATIQFFKADDYNSGHHLPSNVVAQTEQKANGRWAKPVSLVPGRYVLNCFKKNVAGPNAFRLIVE